MKLKISGAGKPWRVNPDQGIRDERYVEMSDGEPWPHVASVYRAWESDEADALAISRVPELLAFVATALDESDEWEALTEESWDKGKALLDGLVEEDG